MRFEGIITPQRILLCGVLALLVALNIAYVTLDTTPQHWDPANHVMHSMRVARSLFGCDAVSVLKTWMTEYVFYPPAFFLLTAPAFGVFGFHIDAGIYWQLLYVGLTMMGIYVMLRRNGHPMAGVLGAAIYMGFPIVLGFSRMTYIENLLALEVVAVLLLVVEGHPFRRPLHGFFLGLLLGLGQMTKWQFVFYVLPIALTGLAAELLHKRKDFAGRREWLWVISSLMVILAGALLIAGPWYGSNLTRILSDVQYHAYVKDMGDPPLTSPQSMLYYLQAFPWQMIGIPMSIALAAALIASVSKPGNPKIPALAMSFLMSIALLSFSRHKEGRFLLPLLPYAAILIAWNVTRMRRHRWKIAAVSLLVLVSALNCIAQTFGSVGLLKEAYLPIGLGRSGYLLRFGTPEWIMLPIRRENWALEDMFKQIASVSANEGVEPTVAWCLKDDHRYYNANTMASYVYAYGKKVNLHKQANFWICRLLSKDFYKDGDVDAERKVFEIGRWTLPDDSEARLYRCRPVVAQLSVPFVLAHDASDFYFPGFYGSEHDFRWSRGTDARIELPISQVEGPADSFTVTFAISGLGKQRVKISLNGIEVWRGVVAEQLLDYSFVLPREHIRTNAENVIAFSLPDARQPNDRDTRVLGIALHELRIAPSEGK